MLIPKRVWLIEPAWIVFAPLVKVDCDKATVANVALTTVNEPPTTGLTGELFTPVSDTLMIPVDDASMSDLTAIVTDEPAGTTNSPDPELKVILPLDTVAASVNLTAPLYK